MNDDHFISTINEILRENHIALPVIKGGVPPTSDDVSLWAGFLESCVKRGVMLSDERWDRVTIQKHKPVTVLALLEAEATTAAPEPDFKVGLQLLLGMLGNEDPER